MSPARDAAPGGRSHPPALLRRTERTLREETSLQSGDRILAAVSGGGDSIALLHVLARLAPRFQIELHAHGVDHGRRAEAGAELDLAQELAEQLGVAFTRSVLSLPDGGNLQARAREARYAALDAAADTLGARWVATAHHADDRAETLLLRLLRGSSPRGLGVLPAGSERRLRPFIRSPKTAILQLLERHGLRHASDPSNTDPRFLRTRIRNELLPLLEQLTPGAVGRLNLLADECTETLVPVVTDAQGQRLDLGRNQAAQIRRAQKLGKPGARIWLPGGRELQVARSGRIEWAPEETGSALPARRETREKSQPRSRKKPRPARQKPAGRGCQTHQK
ncbi:MAG TPA: tRNA lysidine(34) synthetase TilS [Polyangiaceae bacterium]|nr:tRNA lysidine(34) synthetase TilS [Polyangiaceae bacterium]